MVTHPTKVLITVMGAVAIVLVGVSGMRTGSADTNGGPLTVSLECKDPVQQYAVAKDRVDNLERDRGEIKGVLSQANADLHMLAAAETTRLKDNLKTTETDLSNATKKAATLKPAYDACVKK